MFNEDRTRRFAQLDHNLEDCHNKKSWITGETIKGRGYIQITLQSGDKLRVYDDSKNGKHQVQFSGHNNRWSIGGFVLCSHNSLQIRYVSNIRVQ